MTVGGWPLAGKAHIGDDHSLAYSGFLAGVPPAWNVIRAPKAALNPVQAVLLTAGCRAIRPLHAPWRRPGADYRMSPGSGLAIARIPAESVRARTDPIAWNIALRSPGSVYNRPSMAAENGGQPREGAADRVRHLGRRDVRQGERAPAGARSRAASTVARQVPRRPRHIPNGPGRLSRSRLPASQNL